MSVKRDNNLVLVLDDDPFQLKFISRQLHGHGLEVTCCQTGAEALTFIENNAERKILILLDLEMPEMDGVEFIRFLTERRFIVAIAFMSGQDHRVMESAARLVQAHRLKFMGHLAKPVSPDRLDEVLTRWHKLGSGVRHRDPKKYSHDEIQRAISEKELVNFYQPKVLLRDGHMTGVETLVRWQHPDDGLVFPVQFVGGAEESGLIEDLTRMVLASALQQARLWHDQQFNFRVAVNVSMDNLQHVDFPDHVQTEIRRAGVDPQMLILEVTESRLTLDTRLPLDILTRLRWKHVSLSIDDFGTGHSSLAQLRDMPFDELKIDRGFVHGAGTNNTLRSILDASLTMAEQLGITVVAEGIEDLEDWNYLRAHGCDQAQGYFIAKPMPAEALAAWLVEWEARRAGLFPK